MSLASFVADQCLAYLLRSSSDAHRQPRPAEKTPLHPPWSCAAEVFLSRCDGCGKCAAVCPKRIITLAADGIPVVDFSHDACTFCGDCARSCPTGALQFAADQAAWNVRARIESSCLLGSRVLCRSCGDRCEKSAIIFPLAEGQVPTIAADRCTGCGACGSVCPVEAISFAAQPQPAHEPR
jgi:ferredoxin-type protein NapF